MPYSTPKRGFRVMEARSSLGAETIACSNCLTAARYVQYDNRLGSSSGQLRSQLSTFDKLDVLEELTVDRNLLDLPDGRFHPQLVPLEQLAQPVSIDQIDRRGAVPGGLPLGVASEATGRDD